MRRYRLTKRADADLVAIFRRSYRTFGLAQAERYRADLLRTLDLIASNVDMGRAVKVKIAGVRRHEYGSHVIFYRPDVEGVVVIAVLHKRRIASAAL